MAQPVLIVCWNRLIAEHHVPCPITGRMMGCRYETVRNLEIWKSSTDSMVQDYGCRIRYNKESGEVDLVGELLQGSRRRGGQQYA
jgi:hypothetical protein